MGPSAISVHGVGLFLEMRPLLPPGGLGHRSVAIVLYCSLADRI